jgi:hypothetical protein
MNNGRNTSQDLQHRLDQGAHAGGGIFGHINRGRQPDRTCHAHGDQGDEQSAGNERHDAKSAAELALVGAHGGLRVPLQAEEKFERRNELEKSNGFEGDGEDDADGRENGKAGGGEETIADERLEMVAGTELARDALHAGKQDKSAGKQAHQQHEPAAGGDDCSIGGSCRFKHHGRRARTSTGGSFRYGAQSRFELERIGAYFGWEA